MTINENIWFSFIDEANTLLLQDQSVNNYKPHIKILFEPAFDNHIFFQLELDSEKTKWFRSTWVKSSDISKFENPIEKLKYIGKDIQPTIKFESGEVDFDKTKAITDHVRTISINPRIDGLKRMTLDGGQYTLTLGVEQIQTTYKWHTLPDNWKDLQKTANMLLDLSESLK
jgi:hypothetical protein